MDTLTAVRTSAGLRAVYGGISAVATVPVLRAMLHGEEPGGNLVMFARTLAVRNLVFGLGFLSAARRGEAPAGVRRWVMLWLASDLADIAFGATGGRQVGRAGAVTAALVPAPFAAAGVWALRRLPRA